MVIISSSLLFCESQQEVHIILPLTSGRSSSIVTLPTGDVYYSEYMLR